MRDLVDLLKDFGQFSFEFDIKNSQFSFNSENKRNLDVIKNKNLSFSIENNLAKREELEVLRIIYREYNSDNAKKILIFYKKLDQLKDSNSKINKILYKIIPDYKSEISLEQFFNAWIKFIETNEHLHLNTNIYDKYYFELEDEEYKLVNIFPVIDYDDEIKPDRSKILLFIHLSIIIEDKVEFEDNVLSINLDHNETKIKEIKNKLGVKISEGKNVLKLNVNYRNEIKKEEIREMMEYSLKVKSEFKFSSNFSESRSLNSSSRSLVMNLENIEEFSNRSISLPHDTLFTKTNVIACVEQERSRKPFYISKNYRLNFLYFQASLSGLTLINGNSQIVKCDDLNEIDSNDSNHIFNEVYKYKYSQESEDKMIVIPLNFRIPKALNSFDRNAGLNTCPLLSFQPKQNKSSLNLAPQTPKFVFNYFNSNGSFISHSAKSENPKFNFNYLPSNASNNLNKTNNTQASKRKIYFTYSNPVSPKFVIKSSDTNLNTNNQHKFPERYKSKNSKSHIECSNQGKMIHEQTNSHTPQRKYPAVSCNYKPPHPRHLIKMEKIKRKNVYI